MSENATLTLVRNILMNAFNPSLLDIEDEGYLHEGHTPLVRGSAYLNLTIWSEQFKGLPKLEIHRLIYQALGALMKTHIHALSISVPKPK